MQVTRVAQGCALYSCWVQVQTTVWETWQTIICKDDFVMSFGLLEAVHV